MQIRIIALPDGKIQVMVDEATFEEAEQATNQILELLKSKASMPIELVGTVEQHKDGVSHAHVVEKLGTTNG